MIELQSISLHRGNKILLKGASLRIHPGEKTALVGANGCGKTSLFLLLQGLLQVDAGMVSIPAQWRIAHMAQEVAAGDRTALEFVLDGDVELRRIERELAETTDDNHLAHLYGELDAIDGYQAERRAEQLLLGLGFAPAQGQQPVSSFSGGWRIRLNLAQALMCPSDLLLLDEPTNHLDLDASLWLEQWLARYTGTLVLISHDRDFIDNVCEQIVHVENAQLNRYRGNYSGFERQRAERLTQQQVSFEKQQEKIQHIQSFIARFRAKASKAKQAQSRMKELARMETLAPAHIDSPFDFTFPVPERFSDPLLSIQQADLGYVGKVLLGGISLNIHPGSRIGLLGSNGAGKSTLLKSLAGTLPLVLGDRVTGEHAKLGYFTQHQLEALDLDASPILHVQRMSPQAREQDIRDFLGGFNFRGDVATGPIRNSSGGEKARLALALIVWQKPNLLLLDEPTNHLDLEMCHALTVALQEFEGAVVVVSHDRHLLRNTVEELLLVSNGQVTEFDGDLNDYSNWLLSEARNQRRTDAQKEAAKNGASGKDTAKKNTPKNDVVVAADKIDKKAQRQQAADQRSQRSALKQSVQKIEREISTLQQKLAALGELLGDADLYESARRDQLQALLKDQGALQQQLTQKEEQWLVLHEEMDQSEQD
ncbi:MAG: ATPase component of transporter with duplicated ATPase domain [Verrucomicrobiaceae bacterium]|nr:ATPase component of transporter with duplicated ATPase domain [Verrucomicrobiaceae bacterium]